MASCEFRAAARDLKDFLADTTANGTRLFGKFGDILDGWQRFSATHTQVEGWEKGVYNWLRGIDEAITGGKFSISKAANEIYNVQESFHASMRRIELATKATTERLAKLSFAQRKALHRILDGQGTEQFFQGASRWTLDGKPVTKELNDLVVEFREAIDANAKDLIAAGALDPKFAIADYVKHFYSEYEKATVESAKAAKKWLANNKFKSRKDLPKELQEALGLIEDGSISIPRTLEYQRQQLLRALTQQELAAKYGKDVAFDGAVQIPETLAGGNIKKYGALSGKWVTKDVYNALAEQSILERNLGMYEKYYVPLIDHIKVNLTVKNPFTHFYNFGSNMIMAYLQGDLSALGRTLAMAAKNSPEWKGLVKLAEINGLFKSSQLNETVLKNIHYDLPKGMSKLSDLADKIPYIDAFKTLIENIYGTETSATGKAMRAAYGWEDTIFKIAYFADALERAKAEGRKLSESDIAHIAQEAKERYVDYDKPLGSGFQVLDKTLFPFIKYPLRATPQVIKAAVRNPMRFALLQLALVGSGASSIFGEQNEAARPSWASNSANLFGVKDWLMLPSGAWINAGRMLPGVRFNGGLDLSGGFLGTLINILQGETSLGYPITPSETADGLTRTRDKIVEAGRTFLPPLTLGRYAIATADILTGISTSTNYFGEPLGLGEVYSRAFGVRYFNSEKELKTKKTQLDKHFRAIYREILEAGGSNNSKEYKDALAVYTAALNELAAQAKYVQGNTAAYNTRYEIGKFRELINSAPSALPEPKNVKGHTAEDTGGVGTAHKYKPFSIDGIGAPKKFDPFE